MTKTSTNMDESAISGLPNLAHIFKPVLIRNHFRGSSGNKAEEVFKIVTQVASCQQDSDSAALDGVKVVVEFAASGPDAILEGPGAHSTQGALSGLLKVSEGMHVEYPELKAGMAEDRKESVGSGAVHQDVLQEAVKFYSNTDGL